MEFFVERLECRPNRVNFGYEVVVGLTKNIEEKESEKFIKSRQIFRIKCSLKIGHEVFVHVTKLARANRFNIFAQPYGNLLDFYKRT